MTRRVARRSLAGLLAAHAVSQSGNVVALFAVPFAVLAEGGGPAQVGVAAFAASVPVLIGGPLGGLVVDRVGGRAASITADVVSGATLGLIPLLAATVGLPFWALLALLFAGGLLDAPGQTARRVLLPRLAEAAGMRLERAVGLLDSATRLSGLLAAPIAGALVALVGARPALAVTAAAFGVSALVTLLLVRDRGRPVALSRESWGRELAAGLRFLLRDRLMGGLIAVVLVTNVLDAARMSALLPLYADARLGGAGPLGLIVGVFGGAALAGSLLFGLVAHALPRRVPFALCFALAGGPSFAAFAAGLPLAWLLAASVVSGFAAGALNPILGAVQLERVPEPLRGRVFGLTTALAWAGMPFGALLGGLAAAGLGLPTAFAVAGVVYVAVTLTPLAGGPWRLMERGTPEPA